jgi:predicted permease
VTVSWLQRFWNVFGRDVNADIDEEFRFHLDQRIRDNIAAGMSVDEARDDAARRFGSRSAAREHTREADVLVTLETIVQDLAFAFRSLRKHPSFTLVAILTLAFGVGANAAIFTVVYNVLLRPLPFPESDKLFVVSYQPGAAPFWLFPGLSDRNYVAFREADRLFDATASFASAPVTLTGVGDPVRLASSTVTPDFFRVLRVNAAIGRTFVPQDAQPGRDAVVLLGDALWRSRFGSNAAVVGRTITLDGVTRTVVGILPPGFSFPAETALWTPLAIRIEPGMSYTRPVIGRLRPEMTRQQAQAAWETFAGGLPIHNDPTRSKWLARIIPLKDAVVGDVRAPLLIFTGAVAVVLLIVCANVSNLLLMRGVSRRREIVTRLALGAGRPRLVRQLLTETAVMAFGGGIAAMFITLVSVPILLAVVPPERLPRAAEIHINGWVLAFTFALAIGGGLIVGLMPAYHATRTAVWAVWREETLWTTRASNRFRNALVVGEVALALVLLIGAGLLVRSFLRLSAVDPGFRPEHVMTMTVDLPQSTYSAVPRLRAFHQQLLGSLSTLPNAIAVGAVNWLPFGDMSITGDLQLRDGRDSWATKAAISPGYLRAMGVRLESGRDFTDRDHAGAAGVVIVSESLARQLWTNEEPLGQQLSIESRPIETDWLTVVGVVDDVRQNGLKEDVAPAVYQPYQQARNPFFLSRMTFVVRTDGDPRRIAPAMRTALRTVDDDLAAHSIMSMEDVIGRTVAEPRFQTRVLAVFSILALVVAAIGVYGVLAFSVAERRREIGIRIALGAERTALVRMVLRRVLILAVTGVVLGVFGALALSRVLTRLLFEISPTDVPTFVSAAALLMGIALLAGLVPARRATAVDPVMALRAE